jgi:hypothetical protein
VDDYLLVCDLQYNPAVCVYALDGGGVGVGVGAATGPALVASFGTCDTEMDDE